MCSEYYFPAASTSVIPGTSATRWLTEEVFKLIDIVQRDEAIYNPRHKYYFCRPYIENFWREVDIKLEKNSGASLSKWTNLRISFRREYTNFLEEKIPPCWSYFDRMFFLHPYLRKKQIQPRTLEPHIQGALAQINSLPKRLQKERPKPVDNRSKSDYVENYLEFFEDDPRTTSELDEITDEEDQQIRSPEQFCRNQQALSKAGENVINNIDEDSGHDIKSECEDYDGDDDVKITDNVVNNDVYEEDDDDFVVETECGIPEHVQHSEQEQRNRHIKSNTNMISIKRPRTDRETQVVDGTRNVPGKRTQSSDNHSSFITTTPSQHSQYSTLTSAQPNISFVRPTFTKPMELVSAVTNSVPSFGIAQDHSTTISSPLPQQQRTRENSSTSSSTELCECKTDSDAMFLMSLLPDIQKLNGRDRGKIKIAFQNIIQDYLYPE